LQEFSCVYENINNKEKNTEAPLVSRFKKFDIKYVQIKGNIIMFFIRIWDKSQHKSKLQIL
jgi:hypothetical protein